MKHENLQILKQHFNLTTAIFASAISVGLLATTPAQAADLRTETATSSKPPPQFIDQRVVDFMLGSLILGEMGLAAAIWWDRRKRPKESTEPTISAFHL